MRRPAKSRPILISHLSRSLPSVPVGAAFIPVAVAAQVIVGRRTEAAASKS